MPDIGLLNEKPLHASLKHWYAQAGDEFEVPLDGYVIDIVRAEMLLEIQTRNFSAIKTKLNTLTADYPLRLIYPIAEQKWIVKEEANTAAGAANPASRRKSPKRGRLVELFAELVSIPHLLSHPNFSLEVVLVMEEERRCFQGRRQRRNRGWRVLERHLIDVVERHLFESPEDLLHLLPAHLAKSFSTMDLKKDLDISRRLAQQMAYCLQKAGVTETLGRNKNGKLYRVVAR